MPTSSSSRPLEAMRAADSTLAPRDQRVWILEDHQLFRELLVDYLGTLPHIQIAGASADDPSLFRAVARGEVDLVLVDLNLAGAGGMCVLEDLAKSPNAPLAVVLSATVTEHSVSMAVRLGARGYIDKSAGLHELVGALTELSRGGVYFSELPRRLLVDLATRSGRVEDDVVTRRETEVLARFAQGSSVKEVASEIGLSKWAVYRIRNDLRRKLGLHDDKELAEYAVRVGLAGRRQPSD